MLIVVKAKIYKIKKAKMSCKEIPSMQKVWKPELYKIQLDTPTPKALHRSQYKAFENSPEFYGSVYHGIIGHVEVEGFLKNTPDGTYLIRKSPKSNDHYTLSVRFNNKTKHFKIYYKPNEGHYLHEHFKRYETIDELVADGLVNFNMQLHATSIIQEMMRQTKTNYQQSPYMTLNRRKLRALSNDISKTNKPDEAADFSLNQNNESKMNSSTASITPEETDVLPMIYEKNHTFKVHTFKGLNWCEFCANFLWGFTAQGVKCEDCGFMAHNKCSELVPAKCVPDLKRIRGVFGTDLTTIVTLHHCTIPFVIRRCVEEVECRGMLQEGIYRVSGFADEIEALKLALDRDGEKTNMSEVVYGNINVIAGTLKLYLRLLPVPLITFQSYPAFMVATRCTVLTEQIQKMRDAVKKLPLAHYNSLKFMMQHLRKVASHYAVNKMNENNLATVFAPTLIATPQHMTNLSEEIFMLSSLIMHCHAVFQ